MLALVVTFEPKRAETEPDGPLAALADLGCRVVAVSFDLEGLDEEALVRRKPSVIVIDSGDRIDTGYAVLKRLREIAVLEDVPTLMTVTPSRLPSLAFTAFGADDFILS